MGVSRNRTVVPVLRMAAASWRGLAQPLPWRRRASSVCGLFIGLVGACQDPLDELEPGGYRPRIALGDGAPLDEAPCVFRLRIDPAPESLDDLVLFQDELSSYYRGRVAAGDLPDSLAERRVPMLAWRVGTTEAFVQPSQPLAQGTRYTLAALGHGALAQIIIGATEAPLLERRWPRGVGGAFGGVYCLEPGYDLAPFSLMFAPDEARGDFVPFDFAPECAWLSIHDAGGVRVPPPAAGGVLVDPSLLVDLQSLAAPVPALCVDPCVALGPGCICAEDDRAVITGPNEAAFWVLDLAGRSTAGETTAELPLVVAELVPSTSHSLTGVVFDLAGRGTEVAARFRTGAPRARVVINEVYANAAGPEPEQEWVELTNAGTLSTTLAGYVLEDVGGAAVFPDVELAPNAHAIVVNASYSPEPDHDPVPPAGTLVVMVERLGKSGLSNEGEALRLSAPDGEIVSRFPGHRASEAGISIARRTPWADDAATDAFAAHGAPGASPGAPNFFDAPE